MTNALGQITETLAYDGAGRVLSVKDANGVVTDLEYHPRGWLTARKTRGANASESRPTMPSLQSTGEKEVELAVETGAIVPRTTAEGRQAD